MPKFVWLVINVPVIPVTAHHTAPLMLFFREKGAEKTEDREQLAA